MLCQKCGLKEAVVHVVCVVNDKQIDKWLCSDCVEELAPSNFWIRVMIMLEQNISCWRC